MRIYSGVRVFILTLFRHLNFVRSWRRLAVVSYICPFRVVKICKKAPSSVRAYEQNKLVHLKGGKTAATSRRYIVAPVRLRKPLIR